MAGYEGTDRIRTTALHAATALYGSAADQAGSDETDAITRNYINTADAIANWLRDGTKPPAVDADA